MRSRAKISGTSMGVLSLSETFVIIALVVISLRRSQQHSHTWSNGLEASLPDLVTFYS